MLYSVIDPRSNETVFGYLTSGQDKWKLASRSNRTSNKTTFTYDIGGQFTTVTSPGTNPSSKLVRSNWSPSRATILASPRAPL